MGAPSVFEVGASSGLGARPTYCRYEMISETEKQVNIYIYIYIYRSEGFTRTGYFFPGRDGTGVWTFGRFRLPPLKQEAFMLLKHTK